MNKFWGLGLGHESLALARKLFYARPPQNQLVISGGGIMWAVRDVLPKSIIVSPIKHLKIQEETFEYDTFNIGNYWYMPEGSEIKFGKLDASDSSSTD